MSQPRLESLVEACLNTGSGFLIALALLSWVIAPLFDLPVTMGENVAITLIFTVASTARAYVWRRLFNGKAK